MDDLIRRRDVIEHLKKRLYETELNSTAEHPYYEEIADNRVDIWMNELPSAQPEIIRCKECRYKELKGVDYYCDHITGDEIMVSPNDYCSWAEREMDG